MPAPTEVTVFRTTEGKYKGDLFVDPSILVRRKSEEVTKALILRHRPNPEDYPIGKIVCWGDIRSKIHFGKICGWDGLYPLVSVDNTDPRRLDHWFLAWYEN